jgi:cytochrome c556
MAVVSDQLVRKTSRDNFEQEAKNIQESEESLKTVKGNLPSVGKSCMKCHQ